MGYPNLQACVADLEANGQLVRIDTELDGHLDIGCIQRRVWAAGGPALLFTRVRGCQFPVLGNLFGTLERARFLFRDTLPTVEQLVALKADPGHALKQPWRLWGTARAAWHMRPRWKKHGPVLAHQTTLDRLPQLVSWPADGGAFITLPQVYTEDPARPGWRGSNLGMYRVQLGGNRYEPNVEVGLHYQIHRGIGIHHSRAIERGEPLRVSVFVGGPPAMTLSAVMPLPESLPELAFAGALGGRRVPLVRLASGNVVHAEADFCLTGTIVPERLLPEGPFGDHLGYYAQTHDFPVMRVEQVYHRRGAIWPFTTVGRPPQEDTTFGQLIHELTGPAVPSVVPGIEAVHAVDAAGVHPLLLAIGNERYTPYLAPARPAELLTQANAILGQGQMSLAKYLWIAARQDNPALDLHDVAAFLQHMLARVDWQRDLHFHTQTTIDTLDYSGSRLNEGSKLVVAAVGPARRRLLAELPSGFSLPTGYHTPRVVMPGVLAVSGPRYETLPAESGVAAEGGTSAGRRLAALRTLDASHPINAFPLVVVADDSQFVAESLRNFLWVTFTRSNPAADVHGIAEQVSDKHWGCRGSLLIDARRKPHHAPPLEEDPEVVRRVESLAAAGGPLQGLF